ncbi:RING/U-box superfamily protein [Raphanus sativus]|nr:RING/U-box superfamily protein [Raphanus sativus]
MGNACCVAAARDKMVLVVPNSPAAETERRNSSLSWLSDGITHNDASDFKFESPFLSSHGSPSFQTQTLHKSSPSDLSFSRYSSMNTVIEQKENDSPPPQLSLSLASPALPLPSQSYLHPASSPTLQLTHRPRLSKQVSDSHRFYAMNSLSSSSPTEDRLATPLRYDSSQSRPPSEGWSRQAFSGMMPSSRCNQPLSLIITASALNLTRLTTIMANECPIISSKPVVHALDPCQRNPCGAAKRSL